MEGILIRQMTDGDLPTVVDIEKECFSDPWSLQSFSDGMSSGYQSYYVAQSNGKTVGYIALFHIFEEGEVLNLATLPAERGKGIASRLLGFGFDLLKEKGVSRVTLEVRESNVPAKNLYLKHGFTPVSVRKNYYTFPLENGIVMEKHI